MSILISLVASALAVGAPHPSAAQETARAGGDYQGVIGLCVRWKSDPKHVDEVVVVAPTPDAALNQASPEAVKHMTWAPPSGYDGRWLGVNLAVGGGAGSVARPDCSALDHPS